MKIELENVGALANAEILIDGLTVIAGKNGTGKSTILKTLYCIVEPSIDLTSRLRVDFFKNLSRIAMRRYERGSDEASYVNRIIHKSSLIAWDERVLKELIRDLKKSNDGEKIPTNMEIRLNRLEEYLDNPKEVHDYYERYVKDNITSIFKNQFKNLQNSNRAKVTLYTDEGNVCTITVDENNICKMMGTIPDTFSDITYMDTPYVIDYVGNIPSIIIRGFEGVASSIGKDYRKTLIDKIYGDSKDADIFDRMETEKTKERLNSIIEKIIDGVFEINRGKMNYTSEQLKELHAANLATGMKAFSIIKILLDKGYIDADSIILIDEPEIHLHPEWQLILAELLVLICKDIGTKIILTTHSPQFLLAIEAYSMKHEQNINYYNFEKGEDDRIYIENVNKNVEKLYRPMARAYGEADRIYREALNKIHK